MKNLFRFFSAGSAQRVARPAVLLIVMAVAPVAQANVTTVSYWRLGENDPLAGSGQPCSTTTDLVGGRPLQFSQPVYWDFGSMGADAAARVGSTSGLRTYGNESAGTHAAIPLLTENFGLELWVNPNTLTGNQCLAYNGNSSSNGWGLYLIGNQYRGLCGSIGFVGTATATTGAWTHLALVRDSGTTTLYVNGLAAGTLENAPITPVGQMAIMGQAQNPAQERLNGLLDEVRVFTFAPGTFSPNDLLLFNTSMVTTTADAGPGSLRWAMTNLNAGSAAGEITFAVNGTITLASDLPAFTNSATIAGPGSNLLTISGGNSFRLLQLAANTTNHLSGLTLANGRAVNNNSGAALYNLGDTTVTDCQFTGNTVVGGFGGAVANFGNGSLTATNCTFANNTVRGGRGNGGSQGGAGGGGSGMGGAIYTEGTNVTLSGCIFQTNVAAGGDGGPTPSGGGDAGGNGGYPNPGNGGPVFSIGGPGGFGGGGGGGSLSRNGGPAGFGGGGGGAGISGNFGGGGGNFGGNGGNAGYPYGSGGGGGAGLGGAVFARTGTVSAANCAFTGNQAMNGVGGVGLFETTPDGAPGQGVGGAIFVLDATLNLVNPTFTGNTASTGQPNLGASTTVVNTNDSGVGSLRQAVFAANNAGSAATITFAPALAGQTITLTSGQLTLANTVTIDASSLPGGIAISGNNSSRVFEVSAGVTVNLTGLTIQNGFADGAIPDGTGGGVLNSGTLQLTHCTFTACSASLSGGAIHSPGHLTATACTFSDNTSPRGAVNAASTASIFQCTFTGNTATSIGGGALNTSIANAIVTLDSCTISGNAATGEALGGGLRATPGASITIKNCIVAGNTCPTAGSENFDGNFIIIAPNLTSGTPLLAPLGHYGGPTQTMPPLPGSRAIDRLLNGTSFTTDQRGQPRLLGAFADLGAVEGVFDPAFATLNLTQPVPGSVRLTFTNLSGPGYRVLASTDLAAPLNAWSNLGAPLESPAGTFTFTDPGVATFPRRFYRITIP